VDVPDVHKSLGLSTPVINMEPPLVHDLIDALVKMRRKTKKKAAKRKRTTRKKKKLTV